MSRIAVAVLLLGHSLSAAAADPQLEMIAHRGASHDAPENTVAAIKLAWDQGADASEFDI